MDQIVTIEHVRKTFPYTSPDPNSNSDDMWFAYVLGLLGRSRGRFAAQRSQTVALEEISLSILQGEFLGLLGPNGAGKTTLIKVISTILRQDAGTVRINGFDTVEQSAYARASMSVVSASGWLSFDQELTLKQNLEFWGRLCGLSAPDSRCRADESLDVVGLGAWRDETPNHLSSGMRQRLAIAKGLLMRAPVFVLDEPTANVDPIVAWQIREFLRDELNRTLGQTILLATHNMAEAEQLCDRVAIIDHGKVLVVDRPTSLIVGMAGMVMDVLVPTEAANLHLHLKESGVASHVAHSTDSDSPGRLRLLLRPDANRADLDSILSRHVKDYTITNATPILEDVFLHHAGRSGRDEHTDGDTLQS
jgi:ABC-2 type transport system ATP-binding protein